MSRSFVAIGKVEANNAAYVAAQILAQPHQQLVRQVLDERAANASETYAKDPALHATLKV